MDHDPSESHEGLSPPREVPPVFFDLERLFLASRPNAAKTVQTQQPQAAPAAAAIPAG